MLPARFMQKCMTKTLKNGQGMAYSITRRFRHRSVPDNVVENLQFDSPETFSFMHSVPFETRDARLLHDPNAPVSSRDIDREANETGHQKSDVGAQLA